ncbi:hypothetical protein PsorP6_006346 [Peronosclerospora sorghi]|uniref:Uncharacterized protein n=1 Tax=Peronosclerospora sorghi TaxID=230839 RepID=A0ACC0W6F7_9STRA|nr:hypothetical protein PsorP6_006346 [Peronosclerospora sorghi]
MSTMTRYRVVADDVYLPTVEAASVVGSSSMYVFISVDYTLKFEIDHPLLSLYRNLFAVKRLCRHLLHHFNLLLALIHQPFAATHSPFS